MREPGTRFRIHVSRQREAAEAELSLTIYVRSVITTLFLSLYIIVLLNKYYFGLWGHDRAGASRGIFKKKKKKKKRARRLRLVLALLSCFGRLWLFAIRFRTDNTIDVW